MTDLVEIEELLFEVADLRQTHADAPAVQKCLDGAESQLTAAMAAQPPERRALIEAALRLIQVARPDLAPAIAPSTEPDPDPELLESFLYESVEYLAEAEGAVLRLETDPTQRQAIDEVFRAFHTVKGTAAFLELDAITELAHRSENLLSLARTGDVLLTGGVAVAVLAAIDALKAMVAEVRTTRRRPTRSPDLARLMAQIDAAGAGEPQLEAIELKPPLDAAAVDQVTTPTPQPPPRRCHLAPTAMPPTACASASIASIA